MKDISIYFQPVETNIQVSNAKLFGSIAIHDEGGFPDISKHGVALITIPEYRNSSIDTSGEGYQQIREAFYQLYKGDNWNLQVYDLGTIDPGESVNDSYFALSQVIGELLKQGVIPFVIGGSQDLVLSCYKGFESLERMINICAVDYQLNIGDPAKEVEAEGYVSHLLMQRPCYLFNYTNLGLQRPFNSKNDIALFDKLYFDVCRLGEISNDHRVVEPYLRNSDVLTINFESIKTSETDSVIDDNPNGFSSEQMCQIAKYAGISDKMSCVGLFNLRLNQSRVANNLVAQVLWYFIDGMAQRYNDFPACTKKNYTKFHVHIDDFEDDLVFYKSDKSSRWWMEVKYLPKDEQKYERHCMVPCGPEDYKLAMENVIPDLWWKTLKKMS